jgi:hypothetical protein
VARLNVAARLATKRSRSADRVDDGSLHSSGAGTGAGHDARRGRGGAGGPSMSGAVWGASDARRRGAVSALLGGGLSCCCSAGCPFAAPSALRVVGAESSISLAITVGASAFANLERSPFTHHHLIGGRRAYGPGFTAFHAYRARNEW